LDVAGDPAAMGAAHGGAYATEIRDYAADRVDLAAAGTWSGTAAGHDRVLALAEECLPAHEWYAPDLLEELDAIASAAGIGLPEALVVSGFTDVVDVVRARAGEGPFEDSCTAFIVPDDAAGGTGFYGQTWDMHDSATDHVVMLHVEPAGRPAALVFTTVGCVGQLGMNEAGVAIGINNLTAANGTPGVTWPFVVRKALQQADAADAVSCIVDAPVAGGHNYLVFDRAGQGFSVEAMPGRAAVAALDGEPLVHTNHCLAAETLACEATRPAQLQASSESRLARATELLKDRPVDVEQLMALTRDAESICQRPEAPYHVESCGAAIMRPGTGEMWAVWGIPADNEYQRFMIGGRSG
jgi:isopenicillin-N N-acyltransferase-like protein